MDWQAGLGKVVTPEIQMERFACAGSWRAPELVLTNLEAALYGGGLSGRARLDVGSRELQAGARFDFEAHQLCPAPPPGRAIPPQRNPVGAPARDRLRGPGGAAGLDPPAARLGRPTAALAPIGRGFFRRPVLLSRASPSPPLQSRFAYSNRVWDIPGLHLVRPGGEACVDFTGNDETGGFIFIIDSHLDPGGLRPLLPEKQQPLLDRGGLFQNRSAQHPRRNPRPLAGTRKPGRPRPVGRDEFHGPRRKGGQPGGRGGIHQFPGPAAATSGCCQGRGRTGRAVGGDGLDGREEFP